ncbi:transporter substrate-binding domain-containing protein [Pararhizobium sp. YC-54]|uniref:substrate-binding periplasmic protein n=1 Tax=Pararhizobium sp. YC-54 TaxID=2986920 RepID=UPI0021F74CE8|nr:transporter substrate-binding domain-containing protein [Pararhizobium sp. YC-54]MCW0000035.1 transporter substrate-binding domain-containing protein [Pararhizobium sp. YC-54]
MRHIAFALVLLLSGTADAETLRLLTEEYPPYNFSKNGVISGAAVEQAELMMKALGTPYSLEILPWARALSLTENQPWTCLFTTGHDDERDKRFKWVEPLLVDRMVMVRKAGSGVNPANAEQAKRFTVGTQRSDFSANYLEKHDFPKIDLAADLETTVKKLLSGRIDLMMTSEKTFEMMRDQGAALESALVLEGKFYGFACNLGLPDDVVNGMQAQLDKLIADGTQDRIFLKYGLRPNR